MTIVKQGKKFVVESENKEKKLSKPLETKEEAVERLKQVEYFKHAKSKGLKEGK